MMKYIILLLFISTSVNASKLNLWDDFTSPVTTDAKYITLGGLASALAVYGNKDSRTYRKRESLKEAQPFGNYGVIGDAMGKGFLNVGYALFYFGHGYYYNNSSSTKNGEHMAKASFFSTGLTMVLKTLINERRPGYPDDENSFPSGHASGSFAFASVVTARHGWYWGGASYAIATFISISRINDDFHYLHDVLVGATIGAAYGWGTYYNYKNGMNYYFSPILLKSGGGMNISWNL